MAGLLLAFVLSVLTAGVFNRWVERPSSRLRARPRLNGVRMAREGCYAHLSTKALQAAASSATVFIQKQQPEAVPSRPVVNAEPEQQIRSAQIIGFSKAA